MSQSKKEIYMEAQELLADLYFPDEGGSEEEEEEETPKKKRAAKKKTAKPKKETAAQKRKREKAEKEAEDEDGPTLNAVRKAMREFSKEYGKDEAKALLEPYDVASLSALDSDDYQSLLDDVEEASE